MNAIRGTSPAGAPAGPAFGSRPWQVTLVWVLGVALMAGVVATLGGFRQRSDQTISVAAGATVSLALADVRIDAVTATPTLDESGAILPDELWVVTVQAEVRATSKPISASSFSNVVVCSYVNAPGSRVVSSAPTMLLMSADGSQSPRAVLPPSDQFVPVIFKVYISDGLDTDQPWHVGLFPVVYGASSGGVGGDTYQTWLPDDSAHQFWVYSLPISITQQ